MNVADDEEVRGPSTSGNYAYAVVPEWILEAEISAQAVRLFALLDRYVGRNESAWPSRRTLAERMKVTTKTIDRALAELVDVGAIVIEQRYRVDGSLTSSSYVLWPLTMRHGRGEVGTRVSLGTVSNVPSGSNPSEVTPVKRTSLVTASGDRATSKAQARAELLWNEYPRKVGRAVAVKAIVARLKAGVPFEELKEATVNYAALRAGQDHAFTMHGKTFYGSSERWKDYLNDSPELVTARAARPEAVAEQVATATKTLLGLFDVPRETIVRPQPNALVEEILTMHTLTAIGRMDVREVEAMVAALAWSKVKGKR